jgi:hypothetical protein
MTLQEKQDIYFPTFARTSDAKDATERDDPHLLSLAMRW